MPEDLLRRYRPVGPPAALRGRILVPERAAWPWAVAAAALLAGVIAVHVAAGALATRLTGESDDDTRRAMAELTMALGETPEARMVAEMMLVRERARRSAEAQLTGAVTR